MGTVKVYEAFLGKIHTNLLTDSSYTVVLTNEKSHLKGSCVFPGIWGDRVGRKFVSLEKQ